ncbi:MAG TPA: DNA-processing protein DprA [Thermoleophilaceae bacterium]|nr:DNA-processing protein DprA [Thermoleophilaceae bacterium]
MTPCTPCLRRAALVGFLSPRIAGHLAGRRRAAQILALDDGELVAAVGGGMKQAARRMLREFDGERALARLAAAGLHGVCRHEPEYPSQLLELVDPPALLHSTASPARLAGLCGGPAAAVVGTRRASSYGLEVATALGRGLAGAGVAVVSGLALGIDAAAHRGALDAGGSTVAVLGCGADVPYPRTNRALFERIRASGAIVSELPPGARPARWTFPARNRIMAGIASVTIVVEAAERSGSLITVGFAQDLGRDVCAVPGRVTSRIAAGANQLLLEGAHPVRGAADVLDVIFGAGGWEGAAPSRSAAAQPELEPGLRAVLRAVEGGEPLDEAAESASMSAAGLRAALGRLELLGLIRRDGLGDYERTAA